MKIRGGTEKPENAWFCITEKESNLPYAIFTEFDSLILLKIVYILINRFNFEKNFDQIDLLFLIINNLYKALGTH